MEPEKNTPISTLVKEGRYVPVAFCWVIFAITVLFMIAR